MPESTEQLLVRTRRTQERLAEASRDLAALVAELRRRIDDEVLIEEAHRDDSTG